MFQTVSRHPNGSFPAWRQKSKGVLVLFHPTPLGKGRKATGTPRTPAGEIPCTPLSQREGREHPGQESSPAPLVPRGGRGNDPCRGDPLHPLFLAGRERTMIAGVLRRIPTKTLLHHTHFFYGIKARSQRPRRARVLREMTCSSSSSSSNSSEVWRRPQSRRPTAVA